MGTRFMLKVYKKLISNFEILTIFFLQPKIIFKRFCSWFLCINHNFKNIFKKITPQVVNTMSERVHQQLDFGMLNEILLLI